MCENKGFFDFFNEQYDGDIMKIIRIAAPTDSQVRKVENDVKDLKKDVKQEDRRVKDLERDMKRVMGELNMGNRRFFQHKTIFTSLERKIERFEKLEQEWKNYKKELNDVKGLLKNIEKKYRGQVSL